MWKLTIFKKANPLIAIFLMLLNEVDLRLCRIDDFISNQFCFERYIQFFINFHKNIKKFLMIFRYAFNYHG